MVGIIFSVGGEPKSARVYDDWETAYNAATSIALRTLPTLHRTPEVKSQILRELEKNQGIHNSKCQLNLVPCK